LNDTIVALASGAGRAGVAVIRVSGPRAGDLLRALTGAELPEPRRAKRTVFSGVSRDSIDDGIALYFPAPASFTGENVAELHAHGGPAIVAALIQACLAQPETRLAEPGEFTRRAFENGKLDLAQAEALADLVEAETETQRAQALRQMRGELSALYEGWRARLVEAMALLEAEIDFPDEDLPGGLAARVRPLVESLAAEIAAHLDDSHRGERVRDGYRIAILGPPNAGKSSLLNALARREAAIVSDIPGTTRDVVEIRLVLTGYPVWLADTAGLRKAADAIEAEGVRRALERAEEADLRLGLVEAGQEPDPALLAAMRPQDLLLRSKIDLAPAEGLPGFSAVTGAGLVELEALLAERVAAALGGEEAPALTRARHRRLLEDAQAALARAGPALEPESGLGPELAAEDLRAAAASLGRLSGRIDVEDLLDEVFANFCIGK
jgi:tRNA modification GTPase